MSQNTPAYSSSGIPTAHSGFANPTAHSGSAIPTGTDCTDTQNPTLPSIQDLDFSRFAIGQGQFGCPVCQKVIRGTKKDFRRHYMIHTGDKPFACAYCPYRANRSHHLKNHLGIHHPDVAVLVPSVEPQ